MTLQVCALLFAGASANYHCAQTVEYSPVLAEDLKTIDTCTLAPFGYSPYFCAFKLY